MKRRKLLSRALLAVVVGLSLVACATVETVKTASLDDARKQDFSATYDRTNAATLRAMSVMNLNILSSAEDNIGTTYLVSQQMDFFSWGEVGRIIVQKSAAPPTTVYVNWEKRSKLQITGTGQAEFAGLLFAQISLGL